MERVVWEIRTPVKSYGPFDSWNDAWAYMTKENLLGFIVTNKIRNNNETT